MSERPDVAHLRAERRLKPDQKPAAFPVVDNRCQFGRSAPYMTLPETTDWGEHVAVDHDVMFVRSEAGYAHDQQRARQFLVPGNIYTAMTVIVERSSSLVELAEFPGHWFNTMMFMDWPPPIGEEEEE